MIHIQLANNVRQLLLDSVIFHRQYPVNVRQCSYNIVDFLLIYVTITSFYIVVYNVWSRTSFSALRVCYTLQIHSDYTNTPYCTFTIARVYSVSLRRKLQLIGVKWEVGNLTRRCEMIATLLLLQARAYNTLLIQYIALNHAFNELTPNTWSRRITTVVWN